MKILFITKFLVHDNFGRDPLGILYLSSALKRAGHETDICDAYSYKEIKKVFNEFDPDIIGFSITTSTYSEYVSICKELKKLKPKLYSIFGGPHCTFHPEFFKDIPYIDAICLGEGEEAMVDFVNRMESGLKKEETLNFHVKINGTVKTNGVRALIADIDNIFFPDRDLLNRYRYVSNFPVKTFITSRGCPYNCSYCFNYAYAELYSGKGKRVRLRSVENLLEEIKDERSKRRIDFVNFEDDIFGMNLQWLEEFSEKYPAQIGIPFCCNVRVDYITKKTVKLLKKSKCHTCVMGIESGIDTVRKELLNRDMSNERIINACNLIRSEDIVLETENILGLPGVSFSQEKETLLLNIKCKPNYPASYIFQPQPKTILGGKAIESRLFDSNYAKMGNYYKSSVLNLENKKQVIRLRCLFFFIVKFPFLFSHVDILVKIPLTKLYYLFHALARGYMARFRIMPYKFELKEFFYHLYRFLFFN